MCHRLTCGVGDAADDVAALHHLNLFHDKLLIISQDELITCTQFVHCQLQQTLQWVKCYVASSYWTECNVVILHSSIGIFLQIECSCFNIRIEQARGTREDIRIFNNHWNCGFIVWHYCNLFELLYELNRKCAAHKKKCTQLSQYWSARQKSQGFILMLRRHWLW